MNDASKAFFGIETETVKLTAFTTFIRVDGQLQRYEVEAGSHVTAITTVERSGFAGAKKLSPVLVLLEKQHIAVGVNNTQED